MSEEQVQVFDRGYRNRCSYCSNPSKVYVGRPVRKATAVSLCAECEGNLVQSVKERYNLTEKNASEPESPTPELDVFYTDGGGDLRFGPEPDAPGEDPLPAKADKEPEAIDPVPEQAPKGKTPAAQKKTPGGSTKAPAKKPAAPRKTPDKKSGA